MDRNELKRFEGKVEKLPSGCWQWTDSLITQGYGRLCRSDGKAQYAHRLAWEHWRGPITQYTVIEHTCENRGCVNPDHLIARESDGQRRQIA